METFYSRKGVVCELHYLVITANDFPKLALASRPYGKVIELALEGI